MNLSELVIKETIDYILTTNLDDEDKKKAIEILSGKDIEKRNIFILKNLHLFLRTPLIKELYNNKKIIIDYLEEFKGSEYYYGFLNYILKVYPQLNFFTQDFIIDYINSNIEQVGCFYKYYDEPLKSNFIIKYLSNGNIDNFFLINELSESALNNYFDSLSEDNINKLYSTFNNYYGNCNSYLEKKLWNSFKNLIQNDSLNNKFKIIQYFKNIELKKEIFDELGLINYVDYFLNYFEYRNENIFNYVDEDTIFEYCKKQINTNNYRNSLKVLPSEKQISIVKLLIEKKEPYYKYLNILKYEVLSKIYDSNKKIFGISQIYRLYNEFKDKKYLYDLKDSIISDNNFNFNFNYEIIFDNNFIDILSEDEKKIISDKINPKFIINPNNININNYFFNIYKEKYIEYLLNNTTEKVKIGSNISDSINLFEKDKRKIIINHMSVRDIIEYTLESNDNMNYLLDLLNNNPDLLKNSKFTYDLEPLFISLNDEKLSQIDFLLDYLTEEQYILFYSMKIIENNKRVRDSFFYNIENNKYIPNTRDLLKYIEESDLENLFRKMDINSLYYMYLEDDEKIYKLKIKVLKERINELIDINVGFSLSEIYKYMTNQEKINFINGVNDIEKLLGIVYEINEVDKTLLDKIISLYKKELIDLSINNKKYLSYLACPNLNKVNMEQKHYILDNMDIVQLFNLFSNSQDYDVGNKIFDCITKDINIIISDNLNESMIYYLNIIDEERKKYIIDSIDNLINNNELYNNYFKDKVKDFDIIDKINYLYLYQNGYLEKNKEIIQNLLNTNPFLFKTLRSPLLNEEILKMDMHFLSKASKYKKIQNELKILESDINALNFFVNASEKVLNSNCSEVVYDKQISMIIEYLISNKSKLKDFDYNTINNDNINDVIAYILCDYVNIDNRIVFKKWYETIDEMYDININDYVIERRNKCDEAFNKTQNLDDMKNIYFNKYFCMSLTDAYDFYQKYVINYDKVMKYAKNDNPLLFVNLISKIININDPITLREKYFSNEIFFDITDIFEIESIMSQAYFDSLANDYHDKQEGDIISKRIKDKEGNELDLEMTELIDNFGILVHSTCAYGEMPMINDDYFDSWNYNPNTENHGICTSYITNSSYGTADVTGNGVMFGFTSLKNNSIAEYSPYDLATRNSGFNIVCNYAPFYTTLDEIDDYTRHTHNEFDLERRIPDDEYFCVQPDCIVILDDMDDSIKANSIKAYQDFKKHGIELKIIYIDRVKIANMEAEKIKNMIGEYINNNDLNLLKEIINKYESNICGCDYLSTGNEKSKNLFDKDALFMTETIEKLLFDTLDSIISLNDKDGLIYFKSILDNEQFKFDLLDDKNPERKHTFKLYSDELKERINNALEHLNIEYEEIKQY